MKQEGISATLRRSVGSINIEINAEIQRFTLTPAYVCCMTFTDVAAVYIYKTIQCGAFNVGCEYNAGRDSKSPSSHDVHEMHTITMHL